MARNPVVQGRFTTFPRKKVEVPFSATWFFIEAEIPWFHGKKLEIWSTPRALDGVSRGSHGSFPRKKVETLRSVWMGPSHVHCEVTLFSVEVTCTLSSVGFVHYTTVRPTSMGCTSVLCVLVDIVTMTNRDHGGGE